MSHKQGIVKGWRDARTIAFLTLDTLFWSRKTIFVALVSALVLGLSIIGRLVMTYHWIRAPFTSAQVFSTLMSTAVVHFLVVFVTLFYGTALISDELEGKTLTYLFVRPIPKPTIMFGKFLALAWISSILVIPTILLSYLTLYVRADLGPFWEDMPILGKDVGVIFLALLAYGSFFALLGAWVKHSLLFGLIYAFGWEGLISYLPGFTRKLTITHYVQSVFPHNDTATALAMMIGERTPTAEAVITLVLLSAFLVGAASILVREKEYVLEQ